MSLSSPQFPHESWAKAMRPHDELLESTWAAVKAQTPNSKRLAPAADRVFAAMQLPIDQVRVVILGQDPYPGPGEATGIAFQAGNSTGAFPGSLRNIAREYEADVGRSLTASTLDSWMAQGVLLLNTVLTTEVGSSMAHRDLGWELYTRALLQEVADINPQVVGVLWGRQAQALREVFQASSVVESAHPSPLSAHRGFLGSRPFSKVNLILSTQGKSPIVW